MEICKKLKQYDKEIKADIICDYILELSKEGLYHNLLTGKRDKYPSNLKVKGNNFRTVTAGEEYHYAYYFKATSDSEALCVIVLRINIKDVKDGDIREFEEYDRFYITNRKEVFVSSLKSNWGEKIEGTEYSVIDLNKDEPDKTFFLGLFKTIANNCSFVDVDFKNEVQKVFNPMYNLKRWGACVINSPVMLEKYLSDKIIKNKKENLEILDFLLNFDLDIDVRDILRKRNTTRIPRKEVEYSIVERLSDESLVVRIFSASYKNVGIFLYESTHNTMDDFYFLETERIYVIKNTVYALSLNCDGEWVLESIREHKNNVFFPDDPDDFLKNKNNRRFRQAFLVHYDKNDFDGTILQYIKDFLDKFAYYQREYVIEFYLRYPLLVELFIKHRLEFLIQDATDIITRDPLNRLEQCIKFNKERNSFNTILGLSWNQIKILSDIRKEEDIKIKEKKFENIVVRSTIGSIADIKEIYGTDNISYLDDVTFKEILEFVVYDTYQLPYDYFVYLRYIKETYGQQAVINSIRIIKKYDGRFFKEFMDNCLGNLSINYIYFDYIDLIKKTGASGMFSYKIDDPVKLFRDHNILLDLYNASSDMFQKEAFIEAVKRVEKYEFSNSLYSIKIPDSPEEVAAEGSKLNHCVKVYIERIIEGRTNILFLRKNEEIDKPYYTIEVSNDGMVEQIHGLNNCNIEEGSDVEKFVNDWVISKNLQLNDVNKVR